MTAFFLVLFLGALSGSRSQQWRLVWEDNFDFFDEGKWQKEVTAWGGGNGEFQVYTTGGANTFTRNGHLFLKPTRTMDNINPLTGQPFGEDYLHNGVMDLVEMYGYCTNDNNFGCYRDSQFAIIPPAMSGRIRTFERFSFRYGRVEIRARMPVGDWLWPAVWMMSEDEVYGGWPLSGEIDIVESRGNRDLKMPDGHDIGIQEAASTLHWGVSWDQDRWPMTTMARSNHNNDYGHNFHDYVMEWSEDGLRFILDGVLLLDVPFPHIPENPSWTGFYDFGAPWNPGYSNPWENAEHPKMAPFDKPFHFIFCTAVGGNNGYFPDEAINQGGAAPKTWRNGYPNAAEDFWRDQHNWFSTWQGDLPALEIDYVRVYERA